MPKGSFFNHSVNLQPSEEYIVHLEGGRPTCFFMINDLRAWSGFALYYIAGGKVSNIVPHANAISFEITNDIYDIRIKNVGSQERNLKFSVLILGDSVA